MICQNASEYLATAPPYNVPLLLLAGIAGKTGHLLSSLLLPPPHHTSPSPPLTYNSSPLHVLGLLVFHFRHHLPLPNSSPPLPPIAGDDRSLIKRTNASHIDLHL